MLSHPGKYGDMSLVTELAEHGLDGVEVWHPENSDELQEKLIAFAAENGMLTVGGTEFMGMYSKSPISVGDYSTPEASVKALLTYKTKMKKKKAATENK